MPGGCGFFGRDGAVDAAAGVRDADDDDAFADGVRTDVPTDADPDSVGVFLAALVGVEDDDGFGSRVPDGDGIADDRAPVGVVTVRVCDWPGV